MEQALNKQHAEQAAEAYKLHIPYFGSIGSKFTLMSTNLESKNHKLYMCHTYKVALCRQTYVANAAMPTLHTMLTVACYYSECCRIGRLEAPLCLHVIVHPNICFGGIAKKYDLVSAAL